MPFDPSMMATFMNAGTQPVTPTPGGAGGSWTSGMPTPQINWSLLPPWMQQTYFALAGSNDPMANAKMNALMEMARQYQDTSRVQQARSRMAAGDISAQSSGGGNSYQEAPGGWKSIWQQAYNSGPVRGGSGGGGPSMSMGGGGLLNSSGGGSLPGTGGGNSNWSDLPIGGGWFPSTWSNFSGSSQLTPGMLTGSSISLFPGTSNYWK